LAGKIWRIGLMGHSASQRNVLYCLNSLESVLLTEGVPVPSGAAIKAALSEYQN